MSGCVLTTYREFSQFLLHLVQLFLLAGRREQRGGIATLDPVHIDGGLRVGRMHYYYYSKKYYYYKEMVQQTQHKSPGL